MRKPNDKRTEEWPEDLKCSKENSPEPEQKNSRGGTRNLQKTEGDTRSPTDDPMASHDAVVQLEVKDVKVRTDVQVISTSFQNPPLEIMGALLEGSKPALLCSMETQSIPSVWRPLNPSHVWTYIQPFYSRERGAHHHNA